MLLIFEDVAMVREDRHGRQQRSLEKRIGTLGTWVVNGGDAWARYALGRLDGRDGMHLQSTPLDLVETWGPV